MDSARPTASRSSGSISSSFRTNGRLTPRITMNVGLRYEPWFPWEQEYGRYTSWEYGTQSTVKPDAPRGILFPGDPGVPLKTVESDLNNFAPRLGMAWDVNGNGRTVVRGGYGIYYNHISGTSVHAAEAPWTGTVQLLNGPHRGSVRIAESHASAVGRSHLRRVRMRARPARIRGSIARCIRCR